MTKKNKTGPFFPITTLFLVLTTFYIFGFSLLSEWGFDIRVLVVANTLLYGLTFISFYIAKKGLANKNPHVFVRSIMGSMMIKFFVIIIATVVYLMLFRANFNKPAFFTSMGLYLVYLFLEVSILNTMMNQQKKMPKKEVPLNKLENFLPPGTYNAVIHYLQFYKVHLTVARERKSILGNYRHRTANRNHHISVNGNLNAFEFLITLLHELAHLLTFEQFGNKVQSHGKEWKMTYGKVLAQFINNKIFPSDIEVVLLKTLSNPAASSCAEDGLIRVLRKYDNNKMELTLVEELPVKAMFVLDDGRVFQKGNKLRKRFACIEISTGKKYLFSPVYRVNQVHYVN